MYREREREGEREREISSFVGNSARGTLVRHQAQRARKIRRALISTLK